MKKRSAAVDPAPGYAVVVGGPHPYVSGRAFHCSIGDPNARAKATMGCFSSYHKVRPVVLLTLADYRRLLAAARRTKR